MPSDAWREVTANFGQQASDLQARASTRGIRPGIPAAR